MTQPKIDHLEAVRPDSIVQTVIDGVSVYLFSVKAGDVQVWDTGNIGGNGRPNERAEISYAPAFSGDKYKSPYNVTDKTGVQIYDIDYWFKAGWPNHDPVKHEWAVLTQFHPQDINPDPFPGFGGITVHNQAMTIGTPDGSGQDFVIIPIKVESWHKIRMEVNWTSQPDGHVRVIDRATGSLLGQYQGKTIAAGQFKYLKQGYYRAGGLPPGAVAQTQIDINSQASAPAPQASAPAPQVPVPGSYAPTPEDQTVLKLALATFISIAPQIATLQGVINKIQSDVKAVLDKGPKPWPK